VSNRIITDPDELSLIVKPPRPYIEVMKSQDDFILEQRWTKTIQNAGGSLTHASHVFREVLMDHYSEPHRAYHNLEHIKACLRILDSLPEEVGKTPAVELAIWFHDLVYLPQKRLNEEKSAVIFARASDLLDIPMDIVARATWLIMLTTHKHLPQLDDEWLLCDIDLSILGEDRETFDKYEEQIREEYKHVPEDMYKHGRAAILRMFLDRAESGTLYLTPEMSERYAAQAIDNLKYSIGKLT